MTHVLVVRTGSAPDALVEAFGDFHQWFAAYLPAEVAVSDVNLPHGDVMPATLEGIDGLIITGSPAMVTDRAGWSEALIAWLRLHRQDLPPTLAVCYGHQVMATAFGGKVEDNREGRCIGTRPAVRLTEADALMGSLPDNFPVQKSHCQQVVKAPPGATPLAACPNDAHAAWRLDKHLWSMQFHPEFSAEVTRGYIRERHAAIQSEGFDPDALLQAVIPCPEAERLLLRFAALCRREGADAPS